jgi:O-acetyl-ADP-ribose deacetylase (regulator of RNase III)
MPFEIIRNDIINVKADAIVNTANPEPVIGRGTDMAIHHKAGPELLEERKKIGRIEPGCSAVTPAFGLDAKYVIHTVTTYWQDGEHGEAELLRRAYDSALQLADSLECESIAFPLMSSGEYGFPKEIAMSVAISAFTEFLMSHDMSILLVVFGSEAYSLAGSLFNDVRSYVDDRYVEEASIWERKSGDSPKESAPHSVWRREVSFGHPSARPSSSTSSHEPLGNILNLQIGAFDAEEEIELEKSETALEKDETELLSLEDILRRREPTFVEFLRDLIREKELKDPDIYRRGGISRQLFNKMINNLEYQPTKRTVWQLIVGMQLDLIQGRKLMEKAGYSMTRSSKIDLMLEYFILHKRYNIIEIDIALDDAGLPTLQRD